MDAYICKNNKGKRAMNLRVSNMEQERGYVEKREGGNEMM